MYGAAMMMLAFCKKGTKILEIKPIKAGKEFKKISDKLFLQHKEIKITPIYKSSVPQNGLLKCDLKKIRSDLSNFGLNI